MTYLAASSIRRNTVPHSYGPVATQCSRRSYYQFQTEFPSPSYEIVFVSDLVCNTVLAYSLVVITRSPFHLLIITERGVRCTIGNKEFVSPLSTASEHDTLEISKRLKNLEKAIFVLGQL